MRTIFLMLTTIFTAVNGVAQVDFTWQKDLDLPYTDINGNALTGTEVIHLVPHKGKLYAGNSYWNEGTAIRRGQVWVKETANGDWLRDEQMPAQHSRVPSLYSFVFNYDENGNAITADTILFAGATFDKGSNVNGPSVVFMRNDATDTWVRHELGWTNHAFAYTQVRSMGFYHDPVTHADIVFAGANPAPTGVYAGRYDASSPGNIDWDATPEFTPSGYQRIMGFAECNDTLYMATQRELYRRTDGPNPSWTQVVNFATPQIISTYGAGIDPYWITEEDIRGFRAVPNPTGPGEVLLFGALNHMFRVEPMNNYNLVPEMDIEEVLETSTGRDFHYLQIQTIVDLPIPNSTDTVQLIGFEAMYDTTWLNANPLPNIGWFNQEGWYFVREQTGSVVNYTHKEIIDLNISPQPDSLARVRTFTISPFAEDNNEVVYAGGFAPWFTGEVTNTAWIYKGVWNAATATGEVSSDRQVSVFPNPTDAFLNIRMETLTPPVTLKLFDATGRLIRKEMVGSLQQVQYHLPETKGTYFLQMIDSAGQVSTNCVIKK